MDGFSLFIFWRTNCNVLLWRATGLSWKSYLFLPFISLLNIVNTTVNVNYMATLQRRLSMDDGGEKDLEPVPRSVLKCDTDADSELKEGNEKGMRWKGVALVFLLCEKRGFTPARLTTSAWLKCLALWHVAEEMALRPSSCVSLRGKKRKELCMRLDYSPI